MLDTSKTHYAVVTDGSCYAIFNDQYVLLNDMERNIGLYYYHLDPLFKTDLQHQYPEVTQNLMMNLYSYIQEATNTIAEDRICRDNDLTICKNKVNIETQK
jgi:hypothetical protein